jgi:hypothetical protein
LEIVVKFTKNVLLSELPGRYTQVYLDAQAAGKMLYGVPYIELNSKALVALRGFQTSLDKSKISFLYFVGNGEETPTGRQLDILENTTIQLNGGFISGLDTGLDVDLTNMPSYGSVGECLSDFSFRLDNQLLDCHASCSGVQAPCQTRRALPCPRSAS